MAGLPHISFIIDNEDVPLGHFEKLYYIRFFAEKHWEYNVCE